MKAPWDSAFAARLLRSRVLSSLWGCGQPAYHALMKGVVFRNGVKKALGATSFYVGYENRRFNPEQHEGEVDWILSSIKPNMTVLDVGANIGFVSVVLGKKVGPEGKVHAFEPSPMPFRSLKENVLLNGLDQVVECHQNAVSQAPGTVEFFLTDDPYDTQHSLAQLPGVQLSKITVKTVSLDIFCTEHAVQPDVVKVDVEGFEPFVLEGARHLIASNKGVAFFAELHPWIWPTIGYDSAKFLALLDELHLCGVTQDGKPLAAITTRTHVLLTHT